jgi:pimeloyl-ACP methyl ester carboxylesterase
VQRSIPDDPATLVATLDGAAGRRAVTGAGGRVVWRAWGSGPPLVLVHGASGSWTHWIRNIPALAARFTVWIADLPGFGDSHDVPEPHTAEVLAEAVATGVAALLPSTGVRMAGFSFGSIVAGLAAARLGPHVVDLVLIGPGGLALPIAATALTLQRLPPGAGEAEAREVHRANLRTLMLADPAAADDLAVHVQMDNVRRTRFRSGTIPASGVLLPALPAIRAPLTAVYGERDAFVAPDLEARRTVLTARRPDVEFRVVPGAGHWVIYEAAGTMNRMLLEIFSRARPGDRRDRP